MCKQFQCVRARKQWELFFATAEPQKPQAGTWPHHNPGRAEKCATSCHLRHLGKSQSSSQQDPRSGWIFQVKACLKSAAFWQSGVAAQGKPSTRVGSAGSYCDTSNRHRMSLTGDKQEQQGPGVTGEHQAWFLSEMGKKGSLSWQLQAHWRR